MSILAINGTAIKTPSEMTVDVYDIDYEEGTGRNQEGLMFRDYVATKRKVSCKWNYISKSEMATLLTAMQVDSDNAFFTLTYPDPLTGASRTMTAYVGDRSAPVYYYNSTLGKYLYKELSANFIER